MERTRLTNERIKKAECSLGKGQSFLWDSDVKRLAVRITSSGVKSFIFEGKLDRNTIRRTIGDVNTWTIDDARIEARRLQALLDQGIDPREVDAEKKAAKVQKKAEAERAIQEVERNQKFTLRALCEAYTDHLDEKGKKRTAAAFQSAFKVHLFETDSELSQKPAREITPHEIAALIRRILEKGKERTAGVFRSGLAAAYSCGLRAPFDPKLPSTFIDFRIESNPVGPIPAIAIKSRNRTLTRNELKAYMNALGNDKLDLALKLALFSGGQRMAQILRATVSDWNQDSKTLCLSDPKGKRTEPREHLLPLGPIAADIVSELVKRAIKSGSAYLFPATATTPVHISNPGHRLKEISTQIGGEPFDLRDIRRTCETMLAGLGISKDDRAQLLSHGISGVQDKHYDRYSYTTEKQTALIKWERLLNQIAKGETDKKIVPLRRTVKGAANG